MSNGSPPNGSPPGAPPKEQEGSSPSRHERGPPPSSGSHHRPQSAHSTHSSSHSSSSSSKHVKCIGRYVLTGQSLGKGNFARVEAAVHTLTRAKVAIKIIETDKIKEEYVRKNLLREAQLMRRLRHPNIIRLYETMKTNNLYCLVTEIAEGGELLSFVRNDFKEKRLPEATTRPFIRQLTSALFYLHSHGIVHRDLKMENILLDKKKRYIKIVDFGLSNAQKAGALLQTHCGSPEYAAPELFIPGRQYGPEVDVWSLGVNMYAMLVGKLPFRSPRQGTKKRQKLLEQITAGITEHHEKEMEHVSTSACDLICHLLQPDSSRRATLDDVMHHPWITKDGSHQLVPYEYTPPDPITQNLVVELMQKVLGETPTQIKETVKRDRCDWLAAIYNLLMDQPEGRNILQRMITADPIDKLVNSTTDYPTSSPAEHLSLSQGYSSSVLPTHSTSSSQQSHHGDSSDPTGILTKPQSVFPLKHDRHRRHREERVDFDLRSDQRKHVTVDQRTLGQLRGHGYHSSHGGRRLTSDHSPQHYAEISGISKRHTHHPHEEYFGRDYNPAGHLELPPRAHSRMSAPEPLPIPFQKSIFPKSILTHTPSPNEQSPSGTPPPTILSPKSPIDTTSSQENSPHVTRGGSRKKSGGGSGSGANLKPLMKKSYSATVDMMDHHHGLGVVGGAGVGWKGRGQVGPTRRMSAETMNGPSIGWTPSSSSSQRMIPRPVPGDIQSIMTSDHTPQRTILDTTSTGGMRSESMELKHELFIHGRPKRTGTATPPSRQEMTTEGLKIDMIPVNDDRFNRSSSARHHPHSLLALTNQMPEFSASAKHFNEQPTTGLNGMRMKPTAAQRDLPSIIPIKGEKISPSTKKKTLGGILNKAFRPKNTTKEDKTALTLHGTSPNGASESDVM